MSLFESDKEKIRRKIGTKSIYWQKSSLKQELNRQFEKIAVKGELNPINGGKNERKTGTKYIIRKKET